MRKKCKILPFCAKAEVRKTNSTKEKEKIHLLMAKEKKKTQLKAWFRVCRFYSLPASIMPILVGIAAAYAYLVKINCLESFKWEPALCCLLFGLFAQIACNMANDYFDYRSGVDEKGKSKKKRVLLDGEIAPQKLLFVSIFLLSLACLFGLGTLFYAGWPVLLIGISASIAVFAYTSGPYPLAYNALGDLCVLFFYGFCAVGGTFFVLTGSFTFDVTIFSIAMGLIVNNIMMVNNYRDREIDKQAGKRTIANLVSAKTARLFYLLGGVLPVGLCCFFFFLEGRIVAFTLVFAFLMPHLILWRNLCATEKAEELNAILRKTGQLIVLFGSLLIIAIFTTN